MTFAILLLDPDNSGFYGFLGIIPSICLTLFLGVLTLLYYATKRLICFVFAALFYLPNIYLCLILNELEVGQFTTWILVPSTALLLLNIFLLIKLTWQPVASLEDYSIGQNDVAVAVNESATDFFSLQAAWKVIVVAGALSVLFLYIFPKIFLLTSFPGDAVHLSRFLWMGVFVQASAYLIAYLLFTKKLKKYASKTHRAMYIFMLCLHIFTAGSLFFFSILSSLFPL